MDDGALWVAYDTATDEEQKRDLARRIVELHLPFLRWYVEKTAFPYWPAHVREEYLAELVIVALTRVPSYNRLRLGHGGKVAKFVTFLKPYLQGVRWDISAREAPLRVGRETRRMRADAQRFMWEESQAGREPTWEAIAEAVSLAHGKPVSVERIQRIVNPPTVVSGDEPVGENKDQRWDIEAMASESAEDVVVAEESMELLTDAVRSAVADLATTPLERVLVMQRLMAGSGRRWSLREVSEKCGVTPAEVSRVERELTAKLRDRLESVRPVGDP
jgi:DNA-directed RNA polymerase specialized sigma subunit